VKGARLLVTGDTSLVKKLPSKPSRWWSRSLQKY
jgi:hypothetical protein